MKKKDIWISIAIIGAAVLALCFYLLVKGSVKIDAGGAIAVLRLNSIWLSKTTITSEPEPFPVSARAYRPKGLSISMKQDGHTWQIDSRGPWGNLSRIKVKNNETTALRLGPPFLIRPGVRKNGSILSIDYIIVGQAGEQYLNSVRKDNQAIAAAKVKILDEAGNVLEAGRFEYG
jgi:hypothetical protein